MEVPCSQNDLFNPWSSESSNIPSHHQFQTLAERRPMISPKSFTSQSLGEFQDSPKMEKNGALPTTEKRSRKPTKRYIDESVDPTSSHPKKNKSIQVKDHKKGRVGSRAMKSPAEDFPIIAIQVPFGDLEPEESPKSHAYDMVPSSDSRKMATKSKDDSATLDNQKKKGERITSAHPKKRDANVVEGTRENRDICTTTGQKKGERITSAHPKKRDANVVEGTRENRDICTTTGRLRKHDDSLATANRKKKDTLITISPKKMDKCVTDEGPAAERSEEGSGKRKHHRVWSTAEVRKLIDGVSQYGVGKWSRIKNLSFSESPHRTSVDLKDKWRNLLKASGILEQGSDQQGGKRRNMAWRPMPKSILRRVCELAAIYPYPKGQRLEIEPKSHEGSPNGSTDVTEVQM